MKGRRAILTVATAAALVTVARGGHELPVYPSYYPHEIELAAVAPERAAELLLAGKIQAYIGSAPRFAAAPPATIESIASLGSFVLVRVNPSSPLAKDERAACAAVETAVRDLAGSRGELVVHPYPVTPFHGDYLHHVDLAEAAKARVLGGTGGATSLKVKAEGELARSFVRPGQLDDGPDWDVEIVAVDAAALVAGASRSTNGWTGPAWIRSGWFHASLLLNESSGDGQLQRLQAADHADAVGRINLERSLVATLAGACHARVAGYTVKREYFSTVFTAGIENVAHDSIEGFHSPMFIRTVKLKDFPWNGWLALGIDAAPAAAWNPVAGFSDDFGRLMWSAVGDAGLIPSPNDSAWMFNRVTDVQSSARP